MKKGVLLSLALSILLFSLPWGCGPGMYRNPQLNKFHPDPKPKDGLYQIRNSGTKQTLNAVAFINPARGIIAGDNGTILRTRNGSHDWMNVGAGVSALHLYGAAMADTMIAVTVGQYGEILRSIDGGLTWSQVISGNTTHPRTLRGVSFLSGTEGFAVGDSGVIFKTVDAGASWKLIYADSTKFFNGVSFNASNYPYVVGNNGIVLFSTNTGASWSIVPSFTTKNLRSIHFALQGGPMMHSNLGFIVGDEGNIFKTTNNGINWASDISPVTQNLRGVFLTWTKWGYAVGDSGTVVRFNGTNWTLLPKPVPGRLNGVDPIWEPTSTCVGEDGAIVDINPPLVTDTFTLEISSESPCNWNFGLTTSDLYEPEGNIHYRTFEVCSSIEQANFKWGPNTGWAVNERFYSRSVRLQFDHTYTPEELDAIYITTDPFGSVVNGYITCYYMDWDGNPHLLKSGSISCP